MRILGNRIILSLVAIIGLAYFWEFHVKPVSGPLYTAAVAEYKKKNYDGSLKLLRKAYRIDPNDAAVLTLLGWDYLKLGDAAASEPFFQRAQKLSPDVEDSLLGLVDAEIALRKYAEATTLLESLRQRGAATAAVDTHLAWATLYRATGRNRDAVREFRTVLALDGNNSVAFKNLRGIYDVADDPRQISLEFPRPLRPKDLTYTTRVEGDYFAWQLNGKWTSAYLAGVNLTPGLPGHFPADSPIDAAKYLDWLREISNLGANTIRVNTTLPPSFYRVLAEFNSTPSQAPLRLLQGISFAEPPRGDLFDLDYYHACRKEIAGTIDVIHGRGDVAGSGAHAGGIFTADVSPWVAGFLVGQAWPPHIVAENDQLHADLKNYVGNYIEASGSPTEVFLAQMLDYTSEYEEVKYNWLHPVAFLSWPALDPIRHPTESTLLEEIVLRRARGEPVPTPTGPYDDDDAVSLDPMHLRARRRLAAGYFTAYNVFPFYPDFISRDPAYREVRDVRGPNPYFGYLKDLKGRHRGIPLLISEYGVPTSLGIGHFSPAGLNEGGLTPEQQDESLARLTRNISEAGAAGGLVFEWLDQWFRRSWLFRSLEATEERPAVWNDMMDPAQHYGLLAAEPRHRRTHHLSGEPSEWANVPAIYSKHSGPQFARLGDPYDPARELKALYADGDESYFYLRLVVGNLDSNQDGRVDWKQANYLIGIGTSPGQAGLTRLPFIAPVEFSMGMTFAIQLAGPESSRIWVARSYNPFQIVSDQARPTQTVFITKAGWRPKVSEHGGFEAEVIELNRGRFARDGRYFPPERYERGILRYGSLNPKDADYDPLAEWHANVRTGAIDLRIPWNLLNVLDPSSLKVLAGTGRDGNALAEETSGFVLVAFSYRPRESARPLPIMEQSHAIADALPGMVGPTGLFTAGLRQYRWARWQAPEFELRPKAPYSLLKAAFESLTHQPFGSAIFPRGKALRAARPGARPRLSRNEIRDSSRR